MLGEINSNLAQCLFNSGYAIQKPRDRIITKWGFEYEIYSLSITVVNSLFMPFRFRYFVLIPVYLMRLKITLIIRIWKVACEAREVPWWIFLAELFINFQKKIFKVPYFFSIFCSDSKVIHKVFSSMLQNQNTFLLTKNESAMKSPLSGSLNIFYN